MSDAPSTPPNWFDAATAAYALDTIAASLRHDPHWIIETAENRPATFSILSHAPGRALAATLDYEGHTFTLHLAPHPTGWLEITATHNGTKIFEAFLDRPYEEYELWPPAGLREGEAPGRIGKRRTWVTLQAAAWPHLAPFANADGIVSATDAETHLHNPPLTLE